MNIAPPPKLNPSVAALIAAAAAQVEASKELPMHPIERRRQPAPPGYKKVFRGHQPHQSSREMARRRKQMAGKS